MRIAFDATAMLGPDSKNRGIGNYSKGQFQTMINMDEENEYFFFNLFEDISLKEFAGLEKDIREFYSYSGRKQFLLGREYEEILGGIVRHYLEENRIDVFYITSPFDTDGILYKKEWFSGVRVVVLVYDIIPYIFKERYLPEGQYQIYMERVNMLRWADQIQVISQSVKDDMISYLNFSPDNIKVIWGAVDKSYKEIEISEEEKGALYRKFHIKGDFIMCTGGGDARKNLAGLIRAYGKLSPQIRQKYQLVIVCKLRENEVEHYEKIAEESHCKEGLVLTNFVTQEELLQFYNLATLMAFPSIYEGFGLPIVEAWACGTPVLTANNSSLVQIAGNEAVIVEAEKEESITEGLRYALTECDLKELLEKGKKKLQEFQWSRVAEASIGFIMELKTDAPQKVEEGRKKIAFFSPLPPLESGISDYSVDIICELKKYVDIDVFVDDGYEVRAELGEGVNVFSHREYGKKAGTYFDTIYQMGNSTFHTYMYPYIKKCPGTVVLHDYNLHGVAAHTTIGKEVPDYDLYREYLLEDYPEEIVESYVEGLKKQTRGIDIYGMEINGFVTNYAKKVIVHSFEAKRKLMMKNTGIPCRQIWSYGKVEEYRQAYVQEKEECGFSETDIVVAAFGHIHETKRIIPILHAFAALAKNDDRLKLLLAGKLAESLQEEYDATVKELGIRDKIRLTGYISLEEFEKYIDVSDICLNLRYPYNGETSGSLMRIFARGKCVVVNDIGSFAEFPDEICVKIPSAETMDRQEEVAKIQEAVGKLVSDEVYFENIRENAYRFAVENLDIKKVAKSYYEFLQKKAHHSLNEKDFEKIAKNLDKKEDVTKLSETIQYSM